MLTAAAMLAWLGTVSWAAPCAAQDRDGAWSERSRLLGDPGGVRSQLERLGVELQLFYQQTLSWKPSGGGVNRDSVVGYNGSYDFFARVDAEELVGWRGLAALLHVKGQYDFSVNEDVGALSDPIDDADFDRGVYIDELWLQQAFWRDRVRLRAGFLEQQTVYDRNAYANSEDRQFMTTFLDNNGVVPLPNGLGAVLILAPWRWLELAVGAGDADNVPTSAGFDTAFDSFDSLTAYAELTLRSRWQGASGPLPGSWRAGVFLDGRRLAVFGTGQTDRGHRGAYASIDQLVYREEPGSLQGLGLFARVGAADADVNRIAWFWSGGFQYEGLLPCRDADTLGFGVYQTIGSTPYARNVDPDFDRETGFELYYRALAFPWLAITPDFQYIVDPGATGNVDDAMVVSLRLRVSF